MRQRAAPGNKSDESTRERFVIVAHQMIGFRGERLIGLAENPQPYNAHVNAPLHPPYKCVLEKGREPPRFSLDSLHALQLRQNPPISQSKARNGCWRYESPMVNS